jgi:hypothetical protein
MLIPKQLDGQILGRRGTISHKCVDCPCCIIDFAELAQLEDSLQASEQDLKYASTTLQADLDRFQRQKVADLRQMAIQLSKVHREWCKQVSPISLLLPEV